MSMMDQMILIGLILFLNKLTTDIFREGEGEVYQPPLKFDLTFPQNGQKPSWDL